MKNLIFISILTLIFFSCRKQKLKEDKEVFIGEWLHSYTVATKVIGRRYGSDITKDTIYPSKKCSPAKLLFQKNGKVVFNDKETEVKYKMNFKGGENRPFFYMSDGINFQQTEGYEFKANFFYGHRYNSHISIEGYINDETLIIRTTEDEIMGSIYSSTSYTTHRHYLYKH